MTYDPIGDRVLITDNTADGRLYVIDCDRREADDQHGHRRHRRRRRAKHRARFSSRPPRSAARDKCCKLIARRASPRLCWAASALARAWRSTLAAISSCKMPTRRRSPGGLQRLPMTSSGGMLTIGSPEPLLDGMQSSAGVIVVSGNQILTTGSGGLFRVGGTPLAETSFDSNGSASQFATAMAFHPGSLPFDGFSGPGGGRLAYMADFGFASQNSFVTLLTPAQPGDYNGDGQRERRPTTTCWRGAFGTSDLSADGNRDGQVDAADYVLWRKHLPAPARRIAGGSVPEPAASPC